MIIGGFMDTATIIEHLDAEISRLQQAKAVLTGTDVRKGPGRPREPLRRRLIFRGQGVGMEDARVWWV
jgi:hypothetical protein